MGRFRQDLWYRIAIFPVRLPPLRERLGDVPALATHFALKAARRFGTTPIAPSPEHFSLLLGYSWPGNIRELSSVMERAVILGNGRTLDVATALGVGRAPAAPPALAPSAFSHAAPAAPMATNATPSSPALDAAGEATLDAAMVRHIEDALSRCHGRIEGPFGAANVLGINPHTLRSRMRKLGIKWSAFRKQRC
jgi:hydrogenase-4 transcriptional activator